MKWTSLLAFSLVILVVYFDAANADDTRPWRGGGPGHRGPPHHGDDRDDRLRDEDVPDCDDEEVEWENDDPGTDSTPESLWGPLKPDKHLRDEKSEEIWGSERGGKLPTYAIVVIVISSLLLLLTALLVALYKKMRVGRTPEKPTVADITTVDEKMQEAAKYDKEKEAMSTDNPINTYTIVQSAPAYSSCVAPPPSYSTIDLSKVEA